MTHGSYPKAAAFNFLATLQYAFLHRFGEEAVRSAEPEQMQRSFSVEIGELLKKYNDKSNGRIMRLTEKTNQVQREATRAIEKLFERNDNIDVLLERSQTLT